MLRISPHHQVPFSHFCALLSLINMIELSCSNGQDVFVWSAEDWYKLRSELRIVGNPIGSLAPLPRQNSFLGLPVQLLPEETTLLLELNEAKLVNDQSLSNIPSADDLQSFQQLREQSQKDQSQIYIEKRKAQVVQMIDQIVAGKQLQREKLLKKKLAQATGDNTDLDASLKINKEEILKTELDKIVPPPASNALVQIFTADPWSKSEKKVSVEWSYPSSRAEKLKYLTFKNLWEKGFYLTSGIKFGGDFLAYPGDPAKFHARLIVVCVDSLEGVSLRQLVAYGRLGSSNKKTILLSSLTKDNDLVEYKTLNWRDKV